MTDFLSVDPIDYKAIYVTPAVTPATSEILSCLRQAQHLF